jgi:hypothetical protein
LSASFFFFKNHSNFTIQQQNLNGLLLLIGFKKLF